MQTNAMETLIGAIVLLITFAFVFYAYQLAGPQNVGGGYSVVAEFDRADGLAVGADVRVSGIKVGTVTAMRLNDETFGAYVTMTLDSSVSLPEDTSARIASNGLLGQQYVSLEPGGEEATLQETGEISITSGSVDLMRLISQFIFSGPSSKSQGNAQK